jgi:hypothetical protein
MGRARILKGDGFELCEFEILTYGSSLFFTLKVINCVRDTEVSTAYSFSKTYPYMQIYVNSNNREIIQVILIVVNYL